MNYSFQDYEEVAYATANGTRNILTAYKMLGVIAVALPNAFRTFYSVRIPHLTPADVRDHARLLALNPVAVLAA